MLGPTATQGNEYATPISHVIIENYRVRDSQAAFIVPNTPALVQREVPARRSLVCHIFFLGSDGRF
jgi:hypothetical protein